MTTGATLTVRRLCDSAARREHDASTDGQLLRRFLDRRDEAAFAVLLRRHAPMVLGVCRRVLRDPHDADDAFQVTFFVLVRKAAALTSRRTVGDWLHGVAYHTALKTRAASVKRREKERHARRATDAVSGGECDLLPLLDQELGRLPEKYRRPLVLCELEGKSRKEVAALLGIPEGTLSSRLATAKQRLARRLTHLGLPATAAGLTAALADAATAAPASLLETTADAVALLTSAGYAGLIPTKLILLTEGVMKSMLLAKLKLIAGATLLAGTVALTALGFTGHSVQADPPAAAENRDDAKEPSDPPQPIPAAPKIPAAPQRPAPDDDPFRLIPNQEIRGKIIGVEGANASVSIGTDQGVDKGIVLEVFRLRPKPVYLGKLRILAARERDAAGSFVPATRGMTLQIGDEVATRLENEATKPTVSSPERAAVTRKAIEAATALPTTAPQIIKRKSRLLDFIARAQAKDGDRDGAAKTFQLAVVAAEEVKDKSERWWLLMQIAPAQAEAGLLAAALKTVERVTSADPNHAAQVRHQRDAIRYFIVAALAKTGQIPQAKELLETIKITADDSAQRDHALTTVAAAQTRLKDFPGAIETLAAVRGWGLRRQGYGELATAQVRAGDRDGARKIVQILRKEMDRFHDDEPTLAGWVGEVAQAQGMIGDVKEAQEWIEQLKSPELKAEAMFALLNGMAFAPKRAGK